MAGVSIGSCMGGLWARERDIGKVTVKARSFCHKMGEKWRLVLDLTYPYCSMMTGSTGCQNKSGLVQGVP